VPIKLPGRVIENQFFAEGAELVAGIDEVGRGAWAGPVSVGVAVVTRRSIRKLPKGVADSKLLTPQRREELFEPLAAAVEAYAVGHASSVECDQLGMTAAQRLATDRALGALGVAPDALIVDGSFDFTGSDRSRTIVGADRRCIAVAAASVLAKVTRDRMMCELGPSYPQYYFASNKGYPSPDHRAALRQYGLSDIHRASWSFAAELQPEISARGEPGTGL
jgi:ribonuclease HII